MATEDNNTNKTEVDKDFEELLEEFRKFNLKEKEAKEARAALPPMLRQKSAPLWDHMLNPREDGSIDPLNFAERLENDEISYEKAVEEAREYYEKEQKSTKKKGGRRKTRKKRRRRKKGGYNSCAKETVEASDKFCEKYGGPGNTKCDRDPRSPDWGMCFEPQVGEYYPTDVDSSSEDGLLGSDDLTPEDEAWLERDDLAALEGEGTPSSGVDSDGRPRLIRQGGRRRRRKTRKKRRKKRRKTKKRKKRKTRRKKRFRNQRGCKR